MNVYSDTLTHDAILVWLSPPARDVIGGVAMRTAPPPTVADAVPVAELAFVQIGTVLAVADDSPAAEAVTARLILQVLAADDLPAGEVVLGRLSVLLPAVGDDLPPGEALTLALPLPGVSVADALTPDDTVALRASLAVADLLTPTDAAAAQLPLGAIAVDAVPVAEGVNVGLNVLVVRVGDDSPVGEAVTRRQSITLVVVDTIVVDERRNASLLAPKKIKVRGRNATP